MAVSIGSDTCSWQTKFDLSSEIERQAVRNYCYNHDDPCVLNTNVIEDSSSLIVSFGQKQSNTIKFTVRYSQNNGFEEHKGLAKRLSCFLSSRPASHIRTINAVLAALNKPTVIQPAVQALQESIPNSVIQSVSSVVFSSVQNSELSQSIDTTLTSAGEFSQQVTENTYDVRSKYWRNEFGVRLEDNVVRLLESPSTTTQLELSRDEQAHEETDKNDEYGVDISESYMRSLVIKSQADTSKIDERDDRHTQSKIEQAKHDLPECDQAIFEQRQSERGVTLDNERFDEVTKVDSDPKVNIVGVIEFVPIDKYPEVIETEGSKRLIKATPTLQDDIIVSTLQSNPDDEASVMEVKVEFIPIDSYAEDSETEGPKTLKKDTPELQNGTIVSSSQSPSPLSPALEAGISGIEEFISIASPVIENETIEQDLPQDNPELQLDTVASQLWSQSASIASGSGSGSASASASISDELELQLVLPASSSVESELQSVLPASSSVESELQSVLPASSSDEYEDLVPARIIGGRRIKHRKQTSSISDVSRDNSDVVQKNVASNKKDGQKITSEDGRTELRKKYRKALKNINKQSHKKK